MSILKTWSREAGAQPGLILEVISYAAALNVKDKA